MNEIKNKKSFAENFHNSHDGNIRITNYELRYSGFPLIAHSINGHADNNLSIYHKRIYINELFKFT
jgi:hypothetical protein